MKSLFFLIAALFLAGLYPCCAFGAEQDPALRDYFCDEIKKPFFAETSGVKGLFVPQRKEAQPDSFLMPKPAGTKRVFVIGESVAGILGPGRALSVKRTAGDKFTDQVAGRGASEGNAGIEIINCGMGGYESYRIYDVLKEILEYGPDLVVVLSGNNDTREEACPGFFHELRRRKFRLFEKYYSISRPLPEARKKAAMKMHEAMLLEMAASAEKAGTPIVFCTLPAAVKDMPPRRSLPLEDNGFALGYRSFYAKRYREALDRFRLGLAAEPREPVFSFYAAKSLEGLGLREEAAGYYLNALDLDASMSRAGSERNGVIRRAAAEGSACLADLEKLFKKAAPDGLPGFSEFADGTHWTRPHNEAVWEEIFRAAGGCGIKGYEDFTAGGAGKWGESSREVSLKRLSYAYSWMEESGLNEPGLAELARIKAEQPGLLEKAGASPEGLEKLILNNIWSAEKIKNISGLFPYFLAHLAETERRTGNYARALALCDRALLLKPGDSLLRFGRAQILGDMGRKSEEEFLAIAGEPGFYARAASVAAAYGVKVPPPLASKENAGLSKKISDRAALRMLAGDLKAAEELSEKALEKNPYNAEALMNLCSLRQKDGRARQALEACKDAFSAVYRDPANRIPSLEMLSCDAAFESYRLLKDLDREAEGLDILGQCVGRAPPSWRRLGAAMTLLKKR